jgi:hypothetical protein
VGLRSECGMRNVATDAKQGAGEAGVFAAVMDTGRQSGIHKTVCMVVVPLLYFTLRARRLWTTQPGGGC